jgi:hypothetical protein
VQESFPIRWDSSRWTWCRLSCWVRMRWQQLHALDHPLLFVVEEPIFTWFKADDYGMPR